MKPDCIIAIDPDVEKSGIAFLEVATRKLEVSSRPFPWIIDYLKALSAEKGQTVLVVVEAGWLNRSNWHLRGKDNARVASAKGNAAGRNHEVGRKIVEMCRHYGLEVIEQPPLKKYWKGRDGKITHEELASFTGLTGKTNQDGRDAALLAWVHAGLPIRIKNTGYKTDK
jgi:hypothetical protein